MNPFDFAPRTSSITPTSQPMIPQSAMPTPKTPEEARKLKPGTRYRRPDGQIAIR